MSTEETYWAAQARRYDRATLLLNRRHPDMAAAVAHAVDGLDSVLELAAGTGLVTTRAAPGVGRYVATDTSEAMLELLAGRMGPSPNLEVSVADATDLAYADQTFDAVIVANLLHLLPDPNRALAEAARVLKPGGRLVAPTFCHGEGWLARSTSRVLALVNGFPIVTRFAGTDLDELLARAGFSITDARWYPGLLPIRFVVGTQGLE